MTSSVVICVFLGYLALVRIIDYVVGGKVCKMRRESAIEINKQCDEINTKAEALAQQLLQTLKDAESLPEEERGLFMEKCSDLLFEVDKAQHDVQKIRKQFQLEEGLSNV